MTEMTILATVQSFLVNGVLMDALVLDPTGRDVLREAARVRERGPVTRVALPGGVEAWAVTDIALLRHMLTSPLVSKDALLHWRALRDGEIGPQWPLYTWVTNKSMFNSYGQEHRDLRKVAMRAFSARRTREMEPKVRAIVTETVDRLADGQVDGVIDLREGFAAPIPIKVICDLLGVPDDLRGDVLDCADVLMDTAATPEQAVAAQYKLGELILQLVRTKRETPGEDLISTVAAEITDDQTVVSTVRLMIIAGHETTVNLLASASRLLITHPEVLAAAQTGEVSWEDVVDETLRIEPPVVNIPLRFAVEDLELGGVSIAAGEPIIAVFGAPGHDPKLHQEPEKFLPTRTDRQHLAFGGGSHHCVGESLARMEAHIALAALFEKFPNMQLVGDEPGQVPGFVANGPAHVRVLLGT